MAQIRRFGSLLAGHATNNQAQNASELRTDDIVKMGYLAKRKNMNMRYFVLRKETDQDRPAQLECYDSERKFSEGSAPKRKYILKDCFNISRKTDKKNFVIALYINKDCVGLVAESEAEMKEWLQSLQYHKNSSSVDHVDTRKIDYDHVWQVEVLPRSLASVQNLTGKHYLCLTSRLLSLVRLDNREMKKEFQLSTIKKCGFLDQFFFFQLGRYSGIGCGEIYMQTEDSFIAQNIHNSVGSAMNNFRRTSSLTDSDIRRRTTSDPNDECALVIKSRERADSVPNNPRTHFGHRMRLCPSLDKIQQQESTGDHKLKSFAEDGSQGTPDKEFSDFDEEFPHYIPMDTSRVFMEHALISSSLDDGYVPMDGSRDGGGPPKTLDLGSRCVRASPPGPPSMSAMSPISPCVASFATCPSGLSDPAYVPMHSPGSQGAQTPVQNAIQIPTSNPHYLPMGPSPASLKTNHNSVPIALSPSDEDSVDLYGTSETSSCTSGHSSEHRLHDLGVEERGSTPQGLIFGHPLVPSLSGVDETDYMICPRSNRTSSVGSKPDQFKKSSKPDPSFPPTENCRVRAFSLGSRACASHKMGGATVRVGASAGGAVHALEARLGLPEELYSLLKIADKKSSSKSSSAPVLDGSPVSHSWSGTPGSYFRGFIANRSSPRESNLMEMDFTKNRSCDVIPSGAEKDRDKKSSRDRLWQAFIGGYRNRSNSKSSGGSGSKSNSETWLFKDKKQQPSPSENEDPRSEPDHRDAQDYLEIDYSRVKPVNALDSSKGYLPMQPHSYHASSFATYMDTSSSCDKRNPRTYSLTENYLDMSSLNSSLSHDGYVDMSRRDSSCGSGLNITSSSSSSTSNCSGQQGGRSRITPSSLHSPMTSSQELPSPGEEMESDKIESKKGKKESRRKSIKDSALKRKVSEGEALVSNSPDTGLGGGHKSKSGSGPFSSITNFITRSSSHVKGSNKLSNVSKSPKESNSPFSSLRKSKSKERDNSTLSHDQVGSLEKDSSLGSNVTVVSESLSTLPNVQESCAKSNLAASVLSQDLRHTTHTGCKRNSLSISSLPNNISSTCVPTKAEGENKANYVNMRLESSSSLEIPPPIPRNASSPCISSSTVPTAPPDPSPLSEMVWSFAELSLNASQTQTRTQPRPISSDSAPTARTENKPSESIAEKPLNMERCRSHSGPGAPGSSRSASRGPDLERTASAGSSPVSYSPPTSPALGSQSSMSSLSEGGLSSASSTCTVVNVGEKLSNKLPNNALPLDSKTPASSLKDSKDKEEAPKKHVDFHISQNKSIPLPQTGTDVRQSLCLAKVKSSQLSSADLQTSNYVQCDTKKK